MALCMRPLVRAASLCPRLLPERWLAAPSRGSAIFCAPSTSSTSSPKSRQLRPLTKDDVEASFARSGGPGGQNVNKVNTKVDMRFELSKASWVPDDVKEALTRAERNRFTKEGVLVVTSTRHRTQSANFDDALQKLQEMLDQAVEATIVKEADPETKARVAKK